MSPNLDGTGPAGAGPMTGRGLGPCGRGFAIRRGRGFGRGRGFAFVRAIPQSQDWYPVREPTREEEMAELKAEKNAIEAERNAIAEDLKAIDTRLKELETKQNKK